MHGFDPDEESAYVEPDDAPGVQLDDDVVAIDAERALALLDRITHDLPGGGESREGQRAMVRSVAAAFSRRRTTVIVNWASAIATNRHDLSCRAGTPGSNPL